MANGSQAKNPREGQENPGGKNQPAVYVFQLRRPQNLQFR